ncbi:MAG: TlpA family protein disulfide reductase [Chloroflexota bacterium]
MQPPRALVSIALALITAVASGCGAAGTTAAPTAGPGSSDGAACPTTQVSTTPDGWGPPSSAPPVIPILVNSERVCGTNRLVFGLLDSANRPIATPDRSARIAFYDLGYDAAKAVVTVDGTFVWAIEGSRGVYVASVDLTEAGLWGAEFTTAAPGGASETVRITFDVQPTGITKRVGDKAPASKTPTLADVGGDLARISSDATPEPAFYQASVDTAIADGKPFLLAFATPKFCITGQCGPTLDRVKPLVKDYPTVTFINVEPYELAMTNGQLQPVLDAQGRLKPVAAVDDWGLLTEPYIFVVDQTGTITASFEGIVGEDELRAALDAVK